LIQRKAIKLLASLSKSVASSRTREIDMVNKTFDTRR
jgi:hypothetical protein